MTAPNTHPAPPKAAPTPATSQAEARLQLHHAVQAVAAAGNSYLAATADFSHTSLEFDPRLRAFLAARPTTPGAGPLGTLRPALFCDELALALVDESGQELEPRRSLAGRTLEDSFDMMRDLLARHGANPARFTHIQHPDFPKHPLRKGARFLETEVPRSMLLSAIRSLVDLYAATEPALREVATGRPGASPVRTWPHHFDMTTLTTLEAPSKNEDGTTSAGRFVGAGFSPGDANTPEPYWYVTPWPYPDVSNLPALSSGAWHTEGWVGAILRVSQLEGNRIASVEQIRLFFKHAMAVCLPAEI